jgi:hypothetical protein
MRDIANDSKGLVKESSLGKEPISPLVSQKEALDSQEGYFTFFLWAINASIE